MEVRIQRGDFIEFARVSPAKFAGSSCFRRRVFHRQHNTVVRCKTLGKPVPENVGDFESTVDRQRGDLPDEDAHRIIPGGRGIAVADAAPCFAALVSAVRAGPAHGAMAVG